MAPAAVFTVTTPGLIVVMTGAWLAMTVISPSAPGMTTELDLLRNEQALGRNEFELESFSHVT